ncbi:peptide chain release factor N(5)-glutamine methyltransferase [Bermanella marisrubri]|uniref:Release factor glutamine methyltransferase n=1 Tax=Bermanella marisrubri TaxID=207949 RepID=Q1N3L9_9GAMM|nr:peptide chain release factor N(5)-glutamine methyltransferase [Bermanella marisrubri]EAT12855.1 modification methylase, HemK family protein [Oceanobacter sp. RED65] [Bermanella marisrubri]QIZ83176.1 peptide chain release factor N(5)-glutamine methyltransferase [Bermanella marisrubri]
MSVFSLREVVTYGASQLTESDSAKLDAELLLLHVLKQTRTFLFTHSDTELSQEQYLQFTQLLERRKQGEPVAYIIGQTGFWDLTIKVSPATLIPRGDTESLMDYIVEHFNPKNVLDLGTGTGALALATAKEYPQASVVAVDVIEEAVALAKENAKLNKVTNVEILQSDWFALVPKRRFDLIVSNPPYIDANDHHLGEGDVRYEPKSALVAERHGLADIEKICNQALSFLTEDGCLMVEHGYDQGPHVRAIFSQSGFSNIETHQDLAGRDRFTLGYYPFSFV